LSKKVVYFLCTANSCRSQMAEGWARHLAGGALEVYSAGTRPSRVHPLAVRVMAEEGVDISSQTSDAIDPDILARADIVVTLCGDARDSCPAVPGERRHWPLRDPAAAKGDEEQVLSVFREVRDEIRARVKELLRELAGR